MSRKGGSARACHVIVFSKLTQVLTYSKYTSLKELKIPEALAQTKTWLAAPGSLRLRRNVTHERVRARGRPEGERGCGPLPPSPAVVSPSFLVSRERSFPGAHRGGYHEAEHRPEQQSQKQHP